MEVYKLKKVNKWWLLVLLVLVLIVSACSQDSGGGETEETTNDEPANSSDGDEEVELTIGSWRTEDVAQYEKVIEKFNEKYPNIKLTFNPTKNTEYNTILNTALQAGEGPDIFHLRPYGAGIELGEAGYVEPINDLEGLDVFSEDALMASRGENGDQYGVPLNISTTQVYYNKEIFSDLGLEEPTTWDEVID